MYNLHTTTTVSITEFSTIADLKCLLRKACILTCIAQTGEIYLSGACACHNLVKAFWVWRVPSSLALLWHYHRKFSGSKKCPIWVCCQFVTQSTAGGTEQLLTFYGLQLSHQ